MLRMPSCWALRFIMSAKAGSLPASPSAKTAAASFADLVTMPRIRSCTATDSPGRRSSLVGDLLAASTLTGKYWSSRSRPVFSASKVKYKVIILVSEAG